jgi:hypothetical protein
LTAAETLAIAQAVNDEGKKSARLHTPPDAYPIDRRVRIHGQLIVQAGGLQKETLDPWGILLLALQSRSRTPPEAQVVDLIGKLHAAKQAALKPDTDKVKAAAAAAAEAYAWPQVPRSGPAQFTGTIEPSERKKDRKH